MSRNWYSKINKNVQKSGRYHTYLTSLFTNLIQRNGNKRTAEIILDNALKIIKLKVKRHPLIIFELAIRRLTRHFKFKLIKINKGRKFIRLKCTPCESLKKSIKYIISEVRKTLNQKNISESLANELLKIVKKRKKKQFIKRNKYFNESKNKNEINKKRIFKTKIKYNLFYKN